MSLVSEKQDVQEVIFKDWGKMQSDSLKVIENLERSILA